MEPHLPGDPVRGPCPPAPRRGHPDAAVHPALEAAVHAALDDAHRWAERCWLALDASPAIRSSPARLAPGPCPGTVVAHARAAALLPGDPACLSRLAYDLTFAGWRIRRSAGAVEVLIASLVVAGGGPGLRATYATDTGALVLRVSSTPLDVGIERARSLVRS